MSDTGPRTTATDAQERAMVDDAHALHREEGGATGQVTTRGHQRG